MLIHHFEAETQGFHRQHCRLYICIELVELTDQIDCGKNSVWYVTITQNWGKALIGLSQIPKSGYRIFDQSELCHRSESL